MKQALARIAHRGPDSSQLLRREGLGLCLGHTRLAIIDPQSRSDQPFETDRVALVFNGEIYNYRELRSALIAQGQNFITEGDTEVVAHAYACWGTAAFSRLRGMFAVGLYDKAKRQLVLARDGFGIKPLVFMQNADGIIFGSEIKSLAVIRSVSVEQDVLLDLLEWGFQSEARSLYGGVEYVAPGEIIVFKGDTQQPAKVSSTSWSNAETYLAAGKHGDVNGLRGVIEQSVQDHLVADVPVALSLSGGLDSSVVAACAARRHDGLSAFTFTMAEGDDPEVQHASALCRHLGLRHRIARFLPAAHGSEGLLRHVAWNLEEPIGNINALVGFGFPRWIRDAGFKVVLVGEGADELFAGYPWHEYALSGAGKSSVDIYDAYRRRRAQLAMQRFLTPQAKEAAQRRHEDGRDRFARFMAPFGERQLDGFLAFDQSTQLQFSQLLRVDRCFMAHGVEARVPFLYPDVLAAAAALPESQSARPSAQAAGGRSGKIALAEAFAGVLPREIVQRPKFGEKGTVNLWDTWLAAAIESEFERCVHSSELKGARQMLDEFIDWRQVGGGTLLPKEKFLLALLLESVDAVALSRGEPSGDNPIQWQER